MALIEFNAEFNDAEVSVRLAELVARMADPDPFLKSVGEHLVTRTQEHFAGEEDPEGRPWAPLRQSTISRREKKGQLPLTVLRSNSSGKIGSSLAGSINYELTGDGGVRIGSPVVYAAVHQFGAAQGQFGAWMGKDKLGRDHFHHLPWGDIPARPFLGVGQDDGPAIIALAEAWLGE